MDPAKKSLAIRNASLEDAPSLAELLTELGYPVPVPAIAARLDHLLSHLRPCPSCWLMLFNREPQADAAALRHTTLATSRLRFLFVAAKIWRHAGRTGVSYSDHYQEQGVLARLMNRLRGIVQCGQSYAPVMQPALR
jgi:hypothetical protein